MNEQHLAIARYQHRDESHSTTSGTLGIMKLTVIVICYEMHEQVYNTLQSLLPPYQTGVEALDVEILLIDNGSERPLARQTVTLSPQIRYTHIPPREARRSPGAALNAAAQWATAPLLCLMIDGARMLSPGVLSWGLRVCELAPGCIVEVRGWHLSPKRISRTTTAEEMWKREQQVLNEIRWLEDGYRLFDVAVASAQTRMGFAGPTAESNCIFLSRKLFEQIGGFDARYAAPGGGLMNIHFFASAAARAAAVFTLLGEGTFHQAHGGAATGTPTPEMAELLADWRKESAALDGPPLSKAPPRTMLAGHLPSQCVRWLAPQPM